MTYTTDPWRRRRYAVSCRRAREHKNWLHIITTPGKWETSCPNNHRLHESVPKSRRMKVRVWAGW